jgi:nuclear transport factor 2 (NTF2) superfamily protein
MKKGDVINTEEAIKNVEDIYNCHESDRSCSDVETEIIFKNRDKIIELLQQGEKYKKEYVKREAELYLIIKKTRKYKKIVKELEEFSESKALKLHVKENELWKFELKKIIAKYFPKEPPDEKTTKL